MNKYFLYIDILGFSNLVQSKDAKIDQLYNIIASLNVHSHDYFKAIIFSDTIIIYNLGDKFVNENRKYIVMYLCEFVQDLTSRLAGTDIVFRAIITYGEFIHYEINKIPCFYGQALIDTYNSEKQIQAIGLFIDNSCIDSCDIFHFEKFNHKYSYVFTTQSLDKIKEDFDSRFPIHEIEIEGTGLCWNLIPEILFLKYIYLNSINHSNLKIKKKYINTFKLFKKKYPKIIRLLISNGFNPKFISPKVNWDMILSRYPEDFSYVRNQNFPNFP